MSREKQIEEMEKVIADAFMADYNIGCDPCTGTVATALYLEGYRKQSEGEWEKRTFVIFDSEKVGYRCSECNTTWDTPTKPNYCPNCGARMKGGAE